MGPPSLSRCLPPYLVVAAASLEAPLAASMRAPLGGGQERPPAVAAWALPDVGQEKPPAALQPAGPGSDTTSLSLSHSLPQPCGGGGRLGGSPRGAGSSLGGSPLGAGGVPLGPGDWGHQR